MNKIFIHTISVKLPGEKITFDVVFPRTVKKIIGLEITVSLSGSAPANTTPPPDDKPPGADGSGGGGGSTASTNPGTGASNFSRPILSAGELRFRWNSYPEVFLAMNCPLPGIYQDEYWLMKQVYAKYLFRIDFPFGGSKSVPIDVSIPACEEYIQGIYEDCLNKILGVSNPYTVKIYFHYEEL